VGGEQAIPAHAMIRLHRLNGEEIMVNADLIEILQGDLDTIVFLSSGNQLVVREKSDEIVSRIVEFRKRLNETAAKGVTVTGKG
jgi:flagellar protein FlbD